MTNVIALAAILLTTLACQASGWMEAVVAVGTMALVDAGCRLRRGGPIGSVLRPAAMVLLTMVPGLLLFGRFALGGTGPHEIGYGPSPLAGFTASWSAVPSHRLGDQRRGSAFSWGSRSQSWPSVAVSCCAKQTVASQIAPDRIAICASRPACCRSLSWRS